MSLLLRGIIGARPVWELCKKVVENSHSPPKLSFLSRALLSSSPVALSAQQHGHSPGPEDAADDHVPDMLMYMLIFLILIKD